MENSIYIINPYKHNGMWVFDDDRTGLVKEPFVSGIPEIIEEAVKELNEPESGFKLIFSSNPFPGYSLKLEKTGDDTAVRGTDAKHSENPAGFVPHFSNISKMHLKLYMQEFTKMKNK